MLDRERLPIKQTLIILSMSTSVNTNRYVCTIVKTGIENFTRFSGTFVHYIMRDSDGNLFAKRRGIDEQVTMTLQSDKLPRNFPGNLLSIAENSLNMPAVSAIGYNPYKMYNSGFDCVYYSYLNSGVWTSVGLDTRIPGVFPTYAVVVSVDSGGMFFVFQEGNNVSIYSIGVGTITKTGELEDFTLIDASSRGDDIALLLVKNGTKYPSENIYESLLGGSVTYFKNSPVVVLCESLGSYGTFSCFCEERSAFPIMCAKKNLLKNSFMFVGDSKVHVVSLGYSSVANNFVPMVAVGKESDSWRYFDEIAPFGTITGLESPQVCVDSDNKVYVASMKNGQVYLRYFNNASNKWSNFDKNIYLSFNGSVVSSSSSSSSSSS